MEYIEQTIDSREVAGKEHKNLIQNIKRYIQQIDEANKQSGAELKIQLGDFFKLSRYSDSNNQSRPCYKITKKGCEFIAHKMVGVKGTLFTARYINRFTTWRMLSVAGTWKSCSLSALFSFRREKSSFGAEKQGKLPGINNYFKKRL